MIFKVPSNPKHSMKYLLSDTQNHTFININKYLLHVKFPYKLPLTKIYTSWEAVSEVTGNSLAHEQCFIH